MVPAATSASSALQTAGPATPSVFMPCLSSKRITAPLVITFDVPGGPLGQ